MGLEARGDDFYYYHKMRVGDTVQSLYVGRSMLAMSMAMSQQATRLYRNHVQEGRDYFRRWFSATDPGLEALYEQNRAVFTLVLIALGFHNHKGTWRRRRGVPTWTDSAAPLPPTLTTFADRPGPIEIDRGLANRHYLDSMNFHWQTDTLVNHPDQLPYPDAGLGARSFTPTAPIDEAFVDRIINQIEEADLPIGDVDPTAEMHDAQTPDGGLSMETHYSLIQRAARRLIRILMTLPPERTRANAIRSFLATNPEIFDRLGALPAYVARTMCKVYCPGRPQVQHRMLQGLDQYRLDLGYLTVLPHLRPLIDQIALNQLRYLVTAQFHAFLRDKSDEPDAYKTYWSDRLDRADTRHRRSVDTLERILRLSTHSKPVQKDLAAYLERVIPPPDERPDLPQWRWAPDEMPEPGSPVRQPDPRRPLAGIDPDVLATYDAINESDGDLDAHPAEAWAAAAEGSVDALHPEAPPTCEGRPEWADDLRFPADLAPPATRRWTMMRYVSREIELDAWPPPKQPDADGPADA